METSANRPRIDYIYNNRGMAMATVKRLNLAKLQAKHNLRHKRRKKKALKSIFSYKLNKSRIK